MCSGLGSLSSTHMSVWINKSKSCALASSSPSRKKEIVAPSTDMLALFSKSKTVNLLKGMAGLKVWNWNWQKIQFIYQINTKFTATLRIKYSYLWKLFANCKWLHKWKYNYYKCGDPSICTFQAGGDKEKVGTWTWHS